MKKVKNQSPYAFLYEQVGDKKPNFFISVLAAFLSTLCELAPFYVVASMVVKLFAGVDDLWEYGKLALIILAFFVAKIILHCLSTTLSHQATFKILANMRKSLTEKLARMPLGEVNSRPVGALKSTICERVDNIETTLAHIVPEMTSNILPPIVVLVTVFVINWKMGFASLITIPIGIICTMLMMVGTTKFYNKALKATKHLNDTAVEYINGIEVIKVFGKAESSYQKFVDAAKDGADSYISWMRRSNIWFTFAIVIMPATMVSVLPIGAIMLANGDVTIVDMIIIIILTVGMIEPFINVMSYQDDIRQMEVIVKEVQDILDAPELIRPETLASDKQIKDSEIKLENVHFSYQKDEVLHGINLDIKNGEYIALVGPSGSGKSTVAKLIASMWDVNEGSISVGGVNIKDIPGDMYQDLIAYVSQDSYLFNQSIMDNLKMGSNNKDISDEEVINMCKASGVHDFIMSLEHGYDTIVGSGGGHLSGGERQRISIARAMIKDAPIVILDEATAYADPENEAIIQESVSKLVKGKTLIVIAHRLSTVSNADRIVLINNGNIEDIGSHDELISHNGLYKKMWDAHMSIKDSKEAANV